jgi:hypothetical protein
MKLVDRIPPHEFRTALQIICNEFEKAIRACVSRRCLAGTNIWDCKTIVLSDRYAVDVHINLNDPPIFYLVDIFHNEKR